MDLIEEILKIKLGTRRFWLSIGHSKPTFIFTENLSSDHSYAAHGETEKDSCKKGYQLSKISCKELKSLLPSSVVIHIYILSFYVSYILHF